MGNADAQGQVFAAADDVPVSVTSYGDLTGGYTMWRSTLQDATASTFYVSSAVSTVGPIATTTAVAAPGHTESSTALSASSVPTTASSSGNGSETSPSTAAPTSSNGAAFLSAGGMGIVAVGGVFLMGL